MNAKKKVLIIDDDQAACDLIRESLAPMGFDVSSCADPDEAPARAGELDPDLVFISILFPQSNGLKISRAVHAVEGMENVPVIMLISYPEELDPKYTSTIGIVDVALKPLKNEDIISKAVSILGEGTVPGRVDEAGAVVSGPEEPASLDEEWLSFLEKGDTESGEAESPETGEGVAVAEESGKTADETEDFLRGEERHEQMHEAQALRDVAAVPKGRPMKKFLVVASAVLVFVVAASGAFVFFHGTQRKASVPGAKTPAKKAQTVAVQKKETGPPAAKNNTSPGTTQAKAAPPAAAQAVVEKPGGRSPGNDIPAKPADAKQPAKDKKTYSVQVGAFQNEKNAIALSEKLKKKGYDSFISKDNGGVKRVLIGKFEASGKAAVQAKLILEKEGLKSIIYHY